MLFIVWNGDSKQKSYGISFTMKNQAKSLGYINNNFMICLLKIFIFNPIKK